MTNVQRYFEYKGWSIRVWLDGGWFKSYVYRRPNHRIWGAVEAKTAQEALDVATEIVDLREGGAAAQLAALSDPSTPKKTKEPKIDLHERLGWI